MSGNPLIFSAKFAPQIRAERVQNNKKIRALAVVLPQFHPFPENDEWWGKGFTEWTNTVKARPRYKGHYQPQLPADLGFYDMRLLQTLCDQANLAKEYGLYGFCYYHYWFNGKMLMERPLQEILKSDRPDFPFMLAWANENWSRRWDGKDKEVLIEQKYSLEDHRQHATYLCQKVFSDPRYIKIGGKPFFLFYNTHIIPELPEAVKIWREVARENGFDDLYLGGIITSSEFEVNAQEVGLDLVIDWQPDWSHLKIIPGLIQRIKNKLGWGQTYRKIDYAEVVQRMKSKPSFTQKHFKALVPGWDNSARRKNDAFIMHDATPELYEDWLDHTCKTTTIYSEEENFLFINAWNEWAEGNHLEPDKKWGRAFLETTKKILSKYA
ncbi:glycoside hydrolase family 99-like domain-containing protein [Leadbetterella byssophila]|uniref:glycosyltransferase WbsX family protein n=1 Tax=Leadbetterella byssophila TaxID=316068 RepID=UPI0039A0E8A9